MLNLVDLKNEDQCFGGSVRLGDDFFSMQEVERFVFARRRAKRDRQRPIEKRRRLGDLKNIYVGGSRANI